MIDFSFDFSALSAKLDKITEAAEKSTRAAAQSGAQVFYAEAKQRAPVSSHEHSTKGKKHTFQPGNLKNAIYQAFSEKESGATKATYRISWNKKRAFYGQFVEYGTSKMLAQPFLRPAYDAKLAEAVQAVRSRMADEVKRALK